jgi:hypothetical protein
MNQKKLQPMQQIEDAAQNKKTSDLERLFIWELRLVRQVDYRWNHIEASVRLMHRRLADLGLEPDRS